MHAKKILNIVNYILKMSWRLNYIVSFSCSLLNFQNKTKTNNFNFSKFQTRKFLCILRIFTIRRDNALSAIKHVKKKQKCFIIYGLVLPLKLFIGGVILPRKY